MSTGVVAAGALVVAVRRARGELLSSNPDGSPVRPALRVATAAAVTSMIFAGQMLNFPVAQGTSGHLLGGTLAAVLLGPWLGMLSLTVVLTVQALVFADGGLSALGTNVVLMALVGLGAGWTIARVLSRRSRLRGLPLAAGAGALLSVPTAALAFTGLYAVGGTADVPLGALAGQMLGVHLLVGVGEGLITTAVVAAVLVVAPSAVYAARSMGTTRPAPARAPVAALGTAAAAGVLAGVFARFASPHPDGLESVAANLGFDVTAGAHALASWPLAEYGQGGGIDVGAAGIVGVIVTAALLTVVLIAPARRGSEELRLSAREH